MRHESGVLHNKVHSFPLYNKSMEIGIFLFPDVTHLMIISLLGTLYFKTIIEA